MQTKAAVLAAFLLFAGCNADSPIRAATVPASKHTEAEAEQCPLPLLGIAGTWVGLSLFSVDCSACDGWGSEYINTVDTLRVEFAPDPNPTGEPGVTYYDYTLLSYYSPSDWDDPALADLGLPSLYSERRGKMGVYYADGGKWAFNHTETYNRRWNEETKEYVDGSWKSWPDWGFKIKMFDGSLALGWELGDGGYDDDRYVRVDE